jgi:hypothetical protein
MLSIGKFNITMEVTQTEYMTPELVQKKNKQNSNQFANRKEKVLSNYNESKQNVQN